MGMSLRHALLHVPEIQKPQPAQLAIQPPNPQQALVAVQAPPVPKAIAYEPKNPIPNQAENMT